MPDLSQSGVSSGEAYARGWKAGWAAAMAAVREQANRQMFEPPAPEPRDLTSRGRS